jgi:hypothetical protein
MADDIKVVWGAPLPKQTRKKKGSKYDPIIEEFMSREDKTACISIDGVQPTAIASGLKHTIKVSHLDARIQVSNRADAGVWLIKVEPEEQGNPTVF